MKKESNDTQKFIIRSYSKQELAMLYFPLVSPHVAVNRMTGWFRRCRPLSEALTAIHYNKRAKFFTPREVALIIDFIGEP